MDPAGELERVGRPTRAGFVVGAWAVGLVVVIGAALLGATASRPSEAAMGSSIASMATSPPAVAAVASPRPTPVDRGFPRPFHPTHHRPQLREDRRIGGIVLRTAGIPD